MHRRRLAGVAVAVGLVVSGCGHGSAPSHPTGPQAHSPAAGFLTAYVSSDGRVLRRDQGGDIVSESQAYGLLIAELAGRPETARSIWTWTRTHLRRSDGLLAFHATGDGHIQDHNAAADADALAAYALLRYHGDGEAELHAQGAALARAVLDHESVLVDGAPVLVAGNWATGSPPTVNPSYWMPGVFMALARLTHDERWQQAATAAVRLVRQVTDDGRMLPPDWAQVQGSGRLVPTGAPDGSAGVRYGLDAMRLPLWFTYGCTADAKRLAAAWWTNVLSADDRPVDLALSMAGDPIDRAAHPLPLLAGAAAAHAAGDGTRSNTLGQRAAEQSRHTPTYYGAAWVVLATALQDGSLDPCTEG